MAMPTKAKILAAVLLLTSLGGGAVHLNRPASSSSTQSTDDAYVEADLTAVAPQVSGMVVRILVADHQQVRAGDLLALIDERDHAIALQAAKAQVAGAVANIASLQAQLIRQQTTIQQAIATVSADDAGLALARANQVRYRNLAADGSGTLQAQQQAETQLSIQAASLERNRAAVLAARQQVAILQADIDKAKAALEQARTNESAAHLKLSYTRITAPVDGTVGHNTIRVGTFVNAGKPVLSIVPLDAVYITANFRETQLARVQVGQAVDIDVDALPGDRLKGTVQSLGPASGASYSAIAPHNATGNFTKIVQRLPVRIRIDPGQPAMAQLKVGMSVRPLIHIVI
ncbi:MAG: HlyD family secretion protein [Piscinibacter sp.]|uniref:HlyD family secretion protein n=1 Tax=Piscinibacter sp. TaxID=1903157 RepID=UPI00258FBA5D|nr:HlyD family secretion protein [Piscinibacter sp.]MCW5662883.1 HlyD family secretion protein [Piscinibacter sp.]